MEQYTSYIITYQMSRTHRTFDGKNRHKNAIPYDRIKTKRNWYDQKKSITLETA